MRTNTTNFSAILAGEQRSARFKYRHSVAGAAKDAGIPVTWIWFWLLTERLKFKIRLRKVWVRLQAVLELFGDPLAFQNAFYATGEFLSLPEAIQQIAERWPDEPHPYIKFELPPKRPPKAARPDPVRGEEEKSEVVA